MLILLSKLRKVVKKQRLGCIGPDIIVFQDIYHQQFNTIAKKIGQHPTTSSPNLSMSISGWQKVVRPTLDALVPGEREMVEFTYLSGVYRKEITRRINRPLKRGGYKNHRRVRSAPVNTANYYRILCVEDDSDTSELIHLMLERANPAYQITSVKTPENGLALAATKEFDLYVLDYRYPGITGVDICHKIRERDQQTPILFFTGSATKAEREKALACGANAYLIKPDDLRHLTDTVRQLLNREVVSSAA